jgi:rRNA small subunit pseudouridine methyltransferase Nep1
MKHLVILEEASLETVPKRYWADESCRKVQERFGVPPEAQILDNNYHSKIVRKLPNPEKRGRPDIVHFALLDITSTPAYQQGLVQPIIHTINDQTIKLKTGVRLPRTAERFDGVMSKLLRNKIEKDEENLFSIIRSQSISNLVESLNPNRTICLTKEGILKRLSTFFSEIHSGEENLILWIVGGFARGHFREETKKLADDLISISQYSLPAHVVTARISYEIEASSGSS